MDSAMSDRTTLRQSLARLGKRLATCGIGNTAATAGPSPNISPATAAHIRPRHPGWALNTTEPNTARGFYIRHMLDDRHEGLIARSYKGRLRHSRSADQS